MAAFWTATARADRVSKPFWAAVAEAAQASLSCLRAEESQWSTDVLGSMFSRTVSVEVEVKVSKASVADLAARGAVFAVAMMVSDQLPRPVPAQNE